MSHVVGKSDSNGPVNRRLISAIAVGLLPASLVTACGSRVERQAGPAPAITPAADGPTASKAEPAAVPSPAGAPAGVGAPPTNQVGTVTPSTGVTTRTSTGTVDPQLAPRPGRTGPTAEPIAAQPSPTAAPLGSGPASSAAPKELITLATVGNYSGIPGAVFIPATISLQAWSKSTNDRGGLGGHPVRLLVGDDAGDPARHRALLQDFVERQGAVAFVASFAPLTGAAGIDYLNQKRVPTIGGLLIDPWFATSAMHFSHGAAADNYSYISVASVAKLLPADERSVGIITATEAQSSREAGDEWARHGETVGLRVVYKAHASIAQPDFTAECLSAQRAGAKTLILGIDGNSVRRIASSCARQGYRPRISAPVATVEPSVSKDANLQTFLGATPVLPWFLNREFMDMMKRYAPSATPGDVAMEGWVTARIMERIAAQLPARPTSASILELLWSVNGDTLGGLTQPLHFQRDKPNIQNRCWYAVVVRNGSWASPDSGALNCGT